MVLSKCLSIRLDEQKRYTYKTFKEEVDNIAASLLDLGFEKHDRFAVWLPNTSENVAISYAATKLGLIKVLERISLNFLFFYVLF